MSTTPTIPEGSNIELFRQLLRSGGTLYARYLAGEDRTVYKVFFPDRTCPLCGKRAIALIPRESGHDHVAASYGFSNGHYRKASNIETLPFRSLDFEE